MQGGYPPLRVWLGWTQWPLLRWPARAVDDPQGAQLSLRYDGSGRFGERYHGSGRFFPSGPSMVFREHKNALQRQAVHAGPGAGHNQAG